MPNCFHLIRKGENKPSKLLDVDLELCRAFGIPENPDKWLGYDQFGEGADWYNHIGLRLALGKSFDWIEAELAQSEHPYRVFMRSVNTYLRMNFVFDAWYSPR